MAKVWTLYEKAMKSPEYLSHSASAFHEWLLDCGFPRLGSTAGKAQNEAFHTCIEGVFAMDRERLSNFYSGKEAGIS